MRDAIEIEQVSNGFIIRPGYRADMGRCTHPGPDVHVFNTQDQLNEHLTEHFKLPEPAPMPGPPK